MSDSTQIQQRRQNLATRLFAFAAAAAAATIVLPTGTETTSGPLGGMQGTLKVQSTGVVLLLVCAGAYAWTAWTLHEQANVRRLYAWIGNGALALVTAGVVAHLKGDQGSHVTAGAGVLAVACAVGCAIAATIMLHRTSVEPEVAVEIKRQPDASQG